MSTKATAATGRFLSSNSSVLLYVVAAVTAGIIMAGFVLVSRQR